ncbi:MAG: hypothetical protein RL430_140 [Actinomycetota bacterium]|jgi:hypothetical protein
MGESTLDLRRLRSAGLFSIGAGVVHGAAVGLHADHPTLVRIFLACTVLQVGWGILAIERSNRRLAFLGALINGAAVVGWIVTRTKGISFIGGLETAESPQAADTLCAVLGALAAFSAWAGTVPGDVKVRRGAASMVSALMLTTAGLATVRIHDHAHGPEQVAESAFFVDENGAIVAKATTTVPSVPSSESPTTVAPGKVTKSLTGTAPATTSAPKPKVTVPTTVPAPDTTAHSHVTTPAAQLAAASGWPRAFDPAQGINISGIGGVTADQESRARTLITNTMRDLQTYADYRTAVAAGYNSIGDGSTGYEHYVKNSLVNDGKFLDSTAPESIVYKVSNGVKTVVSAMYIAPTFTTIDDYTLTNYAGPLMQWHVHNNLCFGTSAQGTQVVVAVAVNGVCSKGVLQTNGSPMVHVWVVAHPCGPFAAVEGVAAGVAAVPDAQRLDLCNASH